MDRYCEFCVNIRSVVYCKADAAYLCLSCDTKVHSANPLSKRHHRTVICESCKRHPSYVQCYDHQKFMCRGCDLNQHNASSKHRKRIVNSYIGCPSAHDLGVFWGFDLNISLVGLETNAQVKGIDGGMQAFSVVQQLLDLLKVQTYSVDHVSSVIRCQEQKVENNVDRFSQCFLLGGGGSDHRDMSLDPCSSPFTKMDRLESETDLHGDSFWQCKSLVPSGQLWSQNMQDLGVCEEPSRVDDLNMPDIDLTFRNFEELFKNEQDPTRIDQTSTSISNTESSPKKARYTSPMIMSFSHSRLNAESSGTICIESGISPLCGSGEPHVSMKGNKNVQCGYRKARSRTRKRIKSQNWKFKSYEFVTRSC